MIDLYRHRGFALDALSRSDTALVAKDLNSNGSR